MPWITTPIVLALTLAVAAESEPRITYVEGMVSLSPEGVRTAGGRAELVLADGALVHVDGASLVRFESAGALDLSEGRLLVRTGASQASELGVPYARLRLAPLGVYSVLADAARGRLLVAVIVGRIDLETQYGQSARILGGQMVLMTSATSAPWATPFQPAGWDRFELWSDARLSTPVAESGMVLNTQPVSPTCSSWMTVDNPCWILPAYPSTLPGVPPYRPGPPGYAPHYRPNYEPNFDVRPPGISPGALRRAAPGGPELNGSGRSDPQLKSHPAGQPRHNVPATAPPPAPATPNPARRGTGGGIRIPERPSAP
jgi:hypothetical protein